MREILDEFIDTISLMWERSQDPNVELIDVALMLKSALLISDAENFLKEEKQYPFKLRNKTNYSSERKKFRFFSK